MALVKFAHRLQAHVVVLDQWIPSVPAGVLLIQTQPPAGTRLHIYARRICRWLKLCKQRIAESRPAWHACNTEADNFGKLELHLTDLMCALLWRSKLCPRCVVFSILTSIRSNVSK